MQKEKNQPSDKDLENLRKFNWADYKLYNYFKNKLKLEVEKLGKEKVEKVKNEIIHESRRLRMCYPIKVGGKLDKIA